jgi:hypothetical protein
MIRIDFSAATIHVEPTGDPERLAILETMQTRGSISRFEDSEGAALDEEITVRSSGGRVSREYSVLRPGTYTIISGLRDNDQSRTFIFHVSALEAGRMELTLQPGSTRASWVIGDHLAHFDGTSSMRFAVEIDDIVEVENAGRTEFNRATAWERILGDDDDSV